MPAASSVSYQRTREMSIDELLLENRIVFLIGEINHASAARVMMQMLYLENQKRGTEINFYINSRAGPSTTLALYDTMQFLTSPVATYCIGRAYSGGAVLLASGQKGKRYILPHAKVMIHQPYGGVTGQAADIKIRAEQIIKMKRVSTRSSPITPASRTTPSPRTPSVTSTSTPRPRPTASSTRSSSTRRKKCSVTRSGDPPSARRPETHRG